MARVTSDVSHQKTQGGPKARKTDQKTQGVPRARASNGRSPKASAKVVAASFAVKDDESAWTQEELDEVLADLHEHRGRLVTMMGVLEREVTGLMKDAGDGAGHDQADVGATSFERDQDLQLMENERETLAQIDRALTHISEGTYGVCESCGQAIGKMRVMAFPRATLCLPCKQREERR